jgi:thymidine phosphorylase
VQDPVDHAVGIMVLAPPGTQVREGDGVLELHYRDRRRLESALALASGALTVSEAPPASAALVVGEVT